MAKAKLGAARQELQVFSERTTIHGCAELFSIQNAWKAVWIGVMVGVMGFCGKQLFEFLSEVLRDPRITSITYDHHMEMPFTLLRYRSTGWINRSRVEAVGGDDPNITRMLLDKYLFNSYNWPTSCGHGENGEEDVLAKLSEQYPDAAITRAQVQESKQNIQKHFADYNNDIEAFYGSFIREDSNFSSAVAKYYINNNFIVEIDAKLRLGTHGVCSEYVLKNFNITKNAKIVILTAACRSENDTVQLGADSRMRNRDIAPTQAFQCARRYRISIKIATETHHSKYCDRSANRLPLSCESRSLFIFFVVGGYKF